MQQSKAALARLALLVRDDFGLRASDPFDPFVWSNEHGVPFISVQEFAADDAAAQRFLREREGVWSAALIRDGNRHAVLYNSMNSEQRTRSDLTHEIAHFEAAHAVTPSWTSERGCGGATPQAEREAAELAGAILVPAEEARKAAIKGLAPIVVARQFQVSVEMATWRMRESGGYIIARRYAAKQAGRAVG